MRIAVGALVLATMVSADVLAQAGTPSLRVTDPKEVAVLRSLNARIDALSRQVSICVEKKLAAPESCMCRYPNELSALRKEFQSTVRAYPAWSSRAVTWTDNSSGSPVGHTIAIAHLGPELDKCSGKPTVRN